MSRVLAMLDESPVAARVLTTATTIAELIGASVDPLTVVDDDHAATSTNGARLVVGDPVDVLAGELSADDVEFGVLGSRALRDTPGPVGHVADALLARSDVPLVVVAPEGPALEGDDLLFLLPLDGVVASTSAILPVARQLVEAGQRTVTLHVFDPESAPPLATSPYDLDVVAQEFLARHTSECCDRVELRLGEPAVEILDVAEVEQADAIVVSWDGDLGPGHAEVIRHLLRNTTVPVVLRRAGASEASR